MRRRSAPIAALLMLAACSQESTVQEGNEDEGLAGASSGPNPNFDGAAAGDALGEPTSTERDSNPNDVETPADASPN